MMLADMGAEIIRIERIANKESSAEKSKKYDYDFPARGRKSLALDLKSSSGIEIAKQILKDADGLIEGFRPGVMERLGLGPETCLGANPKLVYGRMTGWGQSGPLAHAAGHDLNYIALTGALWATGEASGPPSFAMNLLGDFGGGGMFLAYGMVSALFNAQRTGKGDVVDAAICDGTNTLMTFIHSRRAMGVWRDERGANGLDGGAPWYGVYKCSNGHWISIAAIEPQFWACLLKLLQIDATEFGDRSDRENWPAIRERFTQLFGSQTRAHWTSLLEGTDACFAPVLSPSEAKQHPHNAARQSFYETGPDQPVPAPRMADSKSITPTSPPAPGQHSLQILDGLGFSKSEIQTLVDKNITACPQVDESEKTE